MHQSALLVCTLQQLLTIVLSCSLQEFTRVFTRRLSTNYAEDPVSPFGKEKKSFNQDKVLNCSCGISNLTHFPNGSSESTSEIVPSDVPWLVLIYVVDDSDPKVCSGTIISDRVVLTAASCLVSLPNSDDERYKLLFGKGNSVDPNPHNVVVLQALNETISLHDANTFKRLEVESVSTNPHYIYERIIYNKTDWDIAFIQLKHPLTFNKTAGFAPICLPSKYLTDKELEGVSMISFGWTEINIREASKPFKSTVYSLKAFKALHVHPKRICQSITAPKWISERHFCTNGPLFIQSKFIESRGGPLLVRSSEAPFSFIQYGIISWDFIGILIQKKNVRVASNLSGFLQLIFGFSDSVEAKWCNHDTSNFTEQPKPDPEWNGGTELMELKHLHMISHAEWSIVHSNYRKYHRLSFCRCGQSKKKDLGENSNKHMWNVQILINHENTTETSCDGTIINDKIVLTTASCFHPPGRFNDDNRTEAELNIIYNPQNVAIRLNFNLPDSNANILRATKIIPHVQYTGNLYDGSEADAALLILEITLPLDKLKNIMSPICLPETESSETIEEATLIYQTKTKSQNINADLLEKPFCVDAWKSAEEKGKQSVAVLSKAFKDLFEFTTKSCAAIANDQLKSIGTDINGLALVRVTNTIDNQTATMQIGLISNLTSILLSPISGKEFATTHQDLDLEDKTIIAYNEIRPLLPFIDYFSLVVEARWCPAHHLH